MKFHTGKANYKKNLLTSNDQNTATNTKSNSKNMLPLISRKGCNHLQGLEVVLSGICTVTMNGHQTAIKQIKTQKR